MIKKILLLLYGLLSVSWIVAQSPGGVSGASLWLRADAGIASYFDVPAANRTASSNFSGLGPANSTLTSTSSWSAATNTTGDFLTLDLGSVQTIRGVVTRGRADAAQWVTAYTVSYSTDNISYTSLGSFSGNTDQNTAVINLFTSSVNARYVRFTVNAVSAWPSMRADVVQPLAGADNIPAAFWGDSNSSGNNVAQAAAANRPVYLNSSSNNINFNPTLRFDGSDDFLANNLNTVVNNAGNYTMFGVSSSGSALLTQYSNSSGVDRIAPKLDYGQAVISDTRPTGISFTAFTATPPSDAPNYGLTTFRKNGSSIYLGLNQQVSTSTLGQTPVASNIAGFDIGSRRRDISQERFNGNMSEIITYPSALTDAERNRVETYLSVKYGTTKAGDYVSSGNITVWDAATANVGYNNNIAGIGRDDMGGAPNTGLLQKQSRSVNSGIQPVVGNANTISGTNSANNSTFGNGSFLVWGSNTDPATFTTAINFSGLNNRLERIWKVQETGTVGSVRVALRSSDLPGNVSSPALIVSSDAVFNSSDNIIPMTQANLGGVNYWYADVDLSSGQFFTFGAFVTAPGGVSGASLWLKADGGTSANTDGASISQWSNQNGGTINATQATVSDQPFFRNNATDNINFNPVVSFNGTSSGFNIPTSLIPTGGNYGFAYFGVSNYASGSGPVFAVDVGSATNDPQNFIVNGTTNQVQWHSCNSGSACFVDTPALTSFNVNAMEVYRASGSSTVFATNNRLPAVSNTLSAFTGNPLAIYIGYRNFSGGQFFGGRIPEIILYPSDLTNLQRLRIKSYIALKYGVTLGNSSNVVNYLASDGSTVWAGDTTYQNNIAGIGRDNASALHQKQSRSQNTGSQVVVSLGTIAADNQANSGTLTNGQFFIWGNDNGLLTTFVPTGNTSYPNRFARIWKTQNTGSFAQNITVYYPVSAFGNAAPGTVALLYGASAASLDSGPSAIAQSGTTTINGVSHYIFTVPAAAIANMQFFSFSALQSTPGGVAGASLWLKADAGTSTTTDGGAVSQWNDVSGNLNHFSQGTAASQPLFRNNTTANVNFNPVLDFDGTNDFLDAVSFSVNPANNTIFSAVRPDAFSGPRTVVGSGQLNSNFGGEFRFNNDILEYRQIAGAGVQGSVTSGNLPAAGIPLLFSSSMVSGTNGANIYYNQNRVAFNTISAIPAAFNLVSVGSRTVVSRNFYFDGSVPEVVIYNQQLTALQRLQVDSYLALKYGVTLTRDNDNDLNPGELISGSVLEGDYVASNGARIWNSDATYQNNIAGIGRDDASALHQKQSRSMNSGSQVVVSLGTIAADNQFNSNIILTDRQFFIWGDDAASITRVVKTGNGTYPFRLTRVWRTQNTNSFAQDMTVYYPVSAFSNAPSSTVSLLYGANAGSLSNGTASTIAQSGVTSINGISLYIFTVPAAQVANMQFFSFTGTITGPGGVTEDALWLKADAGTSVTTDAAAVTTWSDQSGNTNDVTQATAANRPLYRNSSSLNINFNPVLSFDGSNDDLRDANGILGTASYTDAAAFVVSNVSTITASSIFSEALGTGTQFNMHAPWTNNEVYWDAGLSNRLNVAWGGATGVPYLWTGWNNGSLTPARVLRRNGLQINSGTGITSFTGNNNVMYIGSNNSGYYNGQIGEIVLYATALSAADRNKAESYMAIKYGLTLDQTAAQNYTAADNTVIWNASANTGYNNNIAGIGRDDASALYQKQSRSINSGLQPVIGNANTIAAANTDNSSTFAADGSFLVWGSNANPSTFTTVINYSGLNRLMERIWRVQEAGTVGSVRVALRSSDLPGNLGSPALIVSSDAAISSSDNIIPMTQAVLGGVSYWYADINLNNGEFFTFGALITAPGGVTGNLQMWLKADAGVAASGNNVSTWNDISGNPAITTQASITPSSDITLSQGAFNFNPALNFTGVDGKRLVGNTTGSGNFSGSLTVYGVSQLTSSLSDIAAVFNTNWKGLQVSNSAYVADGAAAGTVESANTPLGTLFNPQIASVQYTADNTNNSSAYYNGGLSELYTGTGVASTPIAGFEIGGRTAFQDFSRTYRIFRGLIPEVINYKSSTQTPLERLRINTYLAVKYGITLSRDNDGDAAQGEVISGGILEGDYVASDGTTRIWNSDAIYQNNIAGIGRDDVSTLQQKISRSVNTGSILTLATNNNFVLPNTDVSRTGITNDLSFLVIGNNNGSATARAATNLASGFNTRIARLWKVQATNYTQAVSMQFSGLDHANFTWNVVWKSSDDNFTTGSTTLGTLNNSGQITLPAGLASGYLSLQSAALDSDGDSVIDFDDLDDDNDGILDINESSNASVQIAGTGNQIINGVTLSKVLGTGITANIASLGSTCSTAMVSSSGYRFQTTTSTALTFNFSSPVSGNIDVVMNSVYLDEIFTVTSTGGPVSVSTLGTGTCVTVSGNTYRGVSGSSSINDSGSVRLSFNTPVTSITITATGPDLLSFHDFFLNTVIDIDTDNDGIPNRLDLDSDNDGCVDAIEGAAGITPSQLVTASGTVTVGTGSTASNQNLGTSVNAQGVPQFAILPSGYSNTTGQALGTSQTVNTVVVGTASSNQTISANTAPAALALTGSTGGTGFQWQVSSDNIAFTDIPAATSATYSPGTLTATRYYRVNVTSPGGCVFTSNTVTITVNAFCYKPAATVGTTLDAKQGITALGRAGTNNENWPMVRKGAWTVLEAKTKGFVINRLTAAQIAAIPPANLVEGMMVYDTTASCMKVYTSTDGGTTFGWQCITTQTCPD